ncbi:MAG: hypothetical protein ACLTPN_00820 [Clostridia bacterium]|jgi:hypothetical protein
MNIDKNIYFKKDNGEIEYNPLCSECPYNCKQSFRSTIVTCKYTKEQKKKKRR